jgi:hypothetical protein
MPKRSPRIKLFEWRVIQLKATPARLIGYFEGAMPMMLSSGQS